MLSIFQTSLKWMQSYITRNDYCFVYTRKMVKANKRSKEKEALSYFLFLFSLLANTVRQCSTVHRIAKCMSSKFKNWFDLNIAVNTKNSIQSLRLYQSRRKYSIHLPTHTFIMKSWQNIKYEILLSHVGKVMVITHTFFSGIFPVCQGLSNHNSFFFFSSVLIITFVKQYAYRTL